MNTPVSTPSTPAAESDFGFGPPVSLSVKIARSVIFLLIFHACMLGVYTLQSARTKDIVQNPLYEDKGFIPNKDYASAMSLGQDLFMADFYFIRAVQAFGAQYRIADEHYDSVFSFFETISELDPRFIEPYKFGSMVMEEGGHPDKGIELLYKGWVKNPNNHRLPYEAAYLAKWKLDDPAKALYWAHIAAKADDCPEFVKRMIRQFESETGAYASAIEKCLRDFLRTMETKTREVETDIALRHLQNYANEWNLSILNAAAKKLHEDKNGEMLKDLEQLEREGYLKDYTACNYFTTVDRLLDPDYLGGLLQQERLKKPDLTYEGLTEIILPVAIKKLSGVPRSPKDNPPDEKDYYIMRHDTPTPDDYKKLLDEKGLIVNFLDSADITYYGILSFARGMIGQFNEKNGRFPKNLEELGDKGFADPVTGGPLDYDPKTGIVTSPSHPDI